MTGPFFFSKNPDFLDLTFWGKKNGTSTFGPDQFSVQITPELLDRIFFFKVALSGVLVAVKHGTF